MFGGRILLVGVLLGASLGASVAQENLSDWDWTQFYVGAGGGADFANARPDGGSLTIMSHGSTRSATALEPGFNGFVNAGYMGEFEGFILGIDGDIDLAPGVILGAVEPDPFPRDCNSPSYCATAGIHGSLDTLGHIRGIVGLPAGDVMVFAAGGLAVADATVRGVWAEATTSTASSYSSATGTPVTERLYGVSVGIGAQKKVTDNITLRAEVVHDMYLNRVDLGVPVGAGAGASSPGEDASANIGGEHFVFGNTAFRGALMVGF